MPRGRKPKTSPAKPYVKCSLELEPEHIEMLEVIKRQLGTESRSEALRAVFDSGVLVGLEFCFEEIDEELATVDLGAGEVVTPQALPAALAPLALPARR